MSSSKRSFRLFAALITTFAVGLVIVAPRSVSVSSSVAERIEYGMTEQQVVRLVGVPPGDYRTRTAYFGGLCQIILVPADHEQREYTLKKWTTNCGKLEVLFDENERAVAKVFNEPAYSVSWLQDCVDSVLLKLGLRGPRIVCLN